MLTPNDPYYGSRTPRGPALNGFTITPADNVLLPAVTTRLYVGGTGNIALYLQGSPVQAFNENSATNSKDPITASEGPIILQNVPAGTILEIAVKCVMATNTTATDLVGLV